MSRFVTIAASLRGEASGGGKTLVRGHEAGVLALSMTLGRCALVLTAEPDRSARSAELTRR